MTTKKNSNVRHVLRGGSYHGYAGLRCQTLHFKYVPTVRYDFNGFRMVIRRKS